MGKLELKDIQGKAEVFHLLREFGEHFDFGVWLYLCKVPEDALRAYFGSISFIGAILEARERECK